MHGKWDVPEGYSPLWHWVQHQRNCCRFVWSSDAKNNGNNWGLLLLTANRVERFNSLGFKWMVSSSNDITITTAEYKVKYNKAYITQNLQWENNYSALFEYKLKHGHCNVQNDSPLGSWIYLQKFYYTIPHNVHIPNNEQSLLTVDQAERLNTLGINWDTGKSSKWYLQFDALCSYKLNVPQSIKKKSALSRWVRKQRSEFKSGKLKNNLKFHLLDEIYFCWNEQSESLEEEESPPPDLSTWEIRFSELVDYKLKHGNCNVPDEYPLNPELKLWVKHQRFLYKLGCQNEHRLFMNSRSYTKLNELGFSWSIESNCVDKLQRYKNLLLEIKHKHDNNPISKKRNLDSCNAKEEGSHKKERKEKN